MARVISLLENRDPLGAAVLTPCGGPSLNRALVIGITGYPGTGKKYADRSAHHSLPPTGREGRRAGGGYQQPRHERRGPGDRIRMQRHTDDARVYIRSMATRGHRAGSPPPRGRQSTGPDAAGFGRILIETVGVGQSDVDIMQVAITVVAVVAPNLGDDVQAMKVINGLLGGRGIGRRRGEQPQRSRRGAG